MEQERRSIMIDLSKINKQSYLKQILKVDVQRELLELGASDGYASSKLSEKCYELGISDSKTLTKQELLTLKNAL